MLPTVKGGKSRCSSKKVLKNRPQTCFAFPLFYTYSLCSSSFVAKHFEAATSFCTKMATFWRLRLSHSRYLRSNGYVRRLMTEWLRVQIPGLNVWSRILLINLYFYSKDQKKIEKRPQRTLMAQFCQTISVWFICCFSYLGNSMSYKVFSKIFWFWKTSFYVIGPKSSVNT